MPEGDTILRTARVLTRAIAGQEVTAFRTSPPSPSEEGILGRRVERVEARGKNLLIHFDDGRALWTHLRMTGSWHLYRPGERWQKPPSLARAILETRACVAVCFRAPVVKLLSARGLARETARVRLGPDVLSPDFDGREALRRLAALGTLSVGEALLRQSALAGVGNVYKSESLFLCSIDPFARVRDLAATDLERLVDTARRLMQSNLEGLPRATRRCLDGGRFWVYGRAGQPCRRCATSVRMRRQGDAGRSTYFCAVCQGVSAGGGATRG